MSEGEREQSMNIEPTNVSEGLTMAKFEREERYVVVKIKHLGEVKAALLRGFLDGLDAHPIECVVVEHDWPEYEPVWEMIRQRCEGATLSPPLPSPGVERLIPWLEAIREVLREAHFALDDSEDRTDDDPPVHHIPHENVMALDAALKACEALATDDDDPWYGPGPLVTRIIEQLLATSELYEALDDLRGWMMAVAECDHPLIEKAEAALAKARVLASVDTHPKDGDAVAAPSPMSGAVGEAEAPNLPPKGASQ